jgi:hypothetical protein
MLACREGRGSQYDRSGILMQALQLMAWKLQFSC